MDNRIIVADTSSLIALDRIGHLSILKKLYNEIFITSIVRDEFQEELPTWIKIADSEDNTKIRFLSLNLDAGEASSIVLASEHINSLLIIDEKKGRAVAKSLDIKIIGLLGILVKAKQNHHIKTVKELISKLELADFRVSESLKTAI